MPTAVVHSGATVAIRDCYVKPDFGGPRPVERREGQGAMSRLRIHRTGRLQLCDAERPGGLSKEFGSWQLGNRKAAQMVAVVAMDAGGYLFLIGGSKGGDLASGPFTRLTLTSMLLP